MAMPPKHLKPGLINRELLEGLRKFLKDLGEDPEWIEYNATALEKSKKKKRVKPQPRRKPENPSQMVWKPSAYPFEQWRVGKTKRYPVAKEEQVGNRVWHVNARMKRHGFPNHWRHRRVIRHGLLYVEVRRDK